MRAIETSIRVVRLILVLLAVSLQLLRVDGSDRLAEVSIDIRVSEVYLFGVVILEHPWKDIVLIEIVIRTPGVFVEQH